jgi:hypothetical protein
MPVPESARLAAILKNLAPIDAWTLSGTDPKMKIVQNGKIGRIGLESKRFSATERLE